jgi:hypothetical protein
MPDPDNAPVVTKFVGWDDKTILKALGWNPQAVRRALMSQKQATADAPSDWAIYQWASRNKIAAEWRPRLLYTALRLDRIELVEAFRVLDAPAETKDAA